MTRVLYHHRTQAEDGQAVHIRRMIAAFRAEGHEVREEALVPRADQPDLAEDSPEGEGRFSRVLRVPNLVRELAEHGYSWPAARRLVRAGRSFGPDLLYERYAFGNRGGLWASRRLGCPLVLEVNSPMVEELGRTRGLSLRGLAARVEGEVFRGADLVCAVSGVLAGMLEDLGVPRERLLVTPNGVDLEAFDAPDPAAARSELGLPQGVPVLGFVGWVRDWHRLDLVVEGLESAALGDAHLAIVGGGPAVPDLVEAARRAGVSERLHLLGPRRHERIPGLLPAFDVALVPAINPYASPLKLHEYMAAGLAVVAPDQPNLREVLTHGADALLVSPGDGAALVEACGRLVAEGALRARLGREARASLERQDLTWRGNVRRVLAALPGGQA